MKLSNCCGTSPRHVLDEEGGICGECGEHCEYQEEGEETMSQDKPRIMDVLRRCKAFVEIIQEEIGLGPTGKELLQDITAVLQEKP